MIKQEEVYTLSGRTLLHTYSDTNYIIQIETGVEYEEAYDAVPCIYTYLESNQALPTALEENSNDVDLKEKNVIEEKEENII